MGKKIHEFDYTTQQLDSIMQRADAHPFVKWYDEAAEQYRFFPDEERMNIWVEAHLNDAMTPEIAAYEFEQVTAPAPYTVNITVINDNRYVLEGTEGTTLDFTFETRDGHQGIVSESVDVYYTFQSASGNIPDKGIYNPGVQVSKNIDKFLSIGTNRIVITVVGRATHASKTIVATYNVVKLNLSSTFQIARSLEASTSFDVNYTVEGDFDKTIEFYIDGALAANAVVSSLEPVATKVQRMSGLTPGKHTLQMLAKMQIGTYQFRSRLLYYEFIVKGVELTTTVISETFPATQDVFTNSLPGLNGEQYVVKTINWAYYSSRYDMLNAVIQWRLYTEAGEETPLATRTADVVEAETDVPPEPLQFMPTESGAYHLQALINNVVIGDYTIAVILNTAGIIEATDNLTMKLSGLGRDNAEPAETLTSWTDRGFSTAFYNMPWNSNGGWDGNALVLNNGATAVINNKPFAIEVSPTVRNGVTIELDFETYNVNSASAEVLRIGALGTASLVITGDKAVLRSKDGRTIDMSFKSDERNRITFVVYPNTSADYERKVFVYRNGCMSGVINYEIADNFNIGSLADTQSTVGMIHCGNANGTAGIKIYNIYTYDRALNMYEVLNNMIINAGSNINQLVSDNDIYTPGTKILDIDKFSEKITTVKFTGPINELIDRGSGKATVTAKMEITSPDDPDIDMHCDFAQVSNKGQSTLDKPVPSMGVKLDKNGNVCYDRDNRPLSKNRYAFRKGNVPEKKFRLQANYMDSSGCHNGAFLRLFNEVAPKVAISIDKETINPLRIPSERYATDQYPASMQAIHGEDPSGNGWKFPYKINMVPDSIPCVVVWRPDESSAYRFIGQYVIMEEKKANYANGMHSIYSGLDNDGNADPFGFRSSKTGTKLWDNVDCHQMEILRSTEDLTLFLDDSEYDDERDQAFELIYPDEDDLTPAEIEAEWQKYYDDVVHPIVSSLNDQEAFEELLYGEHPKLDRWHFAAYYCLAMRNACTDSLVRNMEFVTYDGQVWLPKWWDVDMQCGLQQTGECNVQPTSTRDTKDPNNPDAYVFSGKIKVGNVVKSSWLLDALEASEQFMDDVKKMDDALYKAGWTYNAMTKLQDEGYVDTWSTALYNESSVAKYLAYNDLLSLQGDRTSHRHWFLRTSYDYFDALHVCGEYTSKIISMRTLGVVPGTEIRFKAAATSYFGWEHTTDIVQSGIKVEKGETGVLTLDRTFFYNDPLHLFAANKMETIDLSELAPYMAADLFFDGTYDELLGSQLIELNMGIPKAEMNEGTFNLGNITTIRGIETFTRVTKFNVQGFQRLAELSMLTMSSLTHFYAAGTVFRSFNPASGSNLQVVELPTTVVSMQMDNCNLTDEDDHCVIKWYETIYDDGQPAGVQETTVPATLRALLFSGMGTDKGTQELVFDWLNAVYDEYGDEGFLELQLTCRNVNWEGVPVEDLLLLAKIPGQGENAPRKVTGRIKCTGELTSADIVAIQAAFGSDVFTNNPGVPLRIDADAGFILGAPSEILAGNTAQVTGVAFPIEGSTTVVTYRLGTYDGQDNFVPQTRLTNLEGRHYYQYKDTVLYEDDGTIVTRETLEPDYNVVVEGATLSTADYATITIKRRSYPTSVNYDVAFTPGKRVSYDSTNNAYYVTDSDLRLTLTAYTVPEQVTGTIDTETWTISNEIASLCRIDNQTGNLLEIYVEDAGLTMSTGTITHTKTYVDGTVRSRTITFRFKTPVAAVTTRHNAPLQASLYNAGYADRSDITMDYEVWQVVDLSFALGSGNTLLHIGELNDFLNLDMTDLDLSNCTNLGNNSNLVDLEDGSQDYINYFPRKSQTLAFDFETIDLSNTHLAGINLKQGSVLESITYGDYTEEVVIVNQSALTEVNIPEDATTTMDKLVIENCNELEEITWI